MRRARHALVWLLTASLATVGAHAETPDDNAGGDSRRPLADRITACTSCHGEQGAGAMHGDTYYPRLANQSEAYLLKQLRDFRAGKRTNDAMQHIVQRLPDDYLQEIAAYFARQDPPYVDLGPDAQSEEVDRHLLRRGRVLATRGKPSADVPACTSCHGPGLAGKSRSGSLLAPRIVAQHETYLSAQFEAWLTGTRRNDPAGVMRGVVERLSATDRRALTAYLSRTRLGEVRRAEIDYERLVAQKPEPSGHEAIEEQQIKRGKYLARAGDCISCHTAPGGKPFAGNRELTTPFGTIYSPNITPDTATGIGQYSADDFYRVMHNGTRPDGTYLYPVMPFAAYTHVTRADTDAIHAYLMSLDPVRQERRPNTFSWPFSMRSLMFGWRMLFFDAGTYQPDPDRSDQWNRGAYLVEGLGHCGSCHTPRNRMGAKIDSRRLSGAELADGWYATNITSDDGHGIGRWSVEQIVRLLKTGRAAGKGHAIGRMGEVVHSSTQYLDTDDLRAIARYLKTVEPKTPTESTETPDADLADAITAGRDIYADNCAECHGDAGKGDPPDYPALAGNHTLAAPNPTNTIRIVSRGGFTTATSGHSQPASMPSFAAQRLTPQEIARVVTYIRAEWGGHRSRVSREQVLEAR